MAAPSNVEVIGGGPAGAVAALAALAEGSAVTIYEQSRLPRHKVCGEFLSPEVASMLTALDLWPAFTAAKPANISRAVLHLGNREKRFDFGLGLGLNLDRRLGALHAAADQAKALELAQALVHHLREQAAAAAQQRTRALWCFGNPAEQTQRPFTADDATIAATLGLSFTLPGYQKVPGATAAAHCLNALLQPGRLGRGATPTLPGRWCRLEPVPSPRCHPRDPIHMRRTLTLSFLLLGSTSLYAQTTTNSTESFRNAVMDYDQARQRLVFALPSRELWEWDGQYWGKAKATLPTAVSTALYDGSRQRMLFASSTTLYSYDGDALVGHALPATLPASSLATLSVDVHRGRVLALVQQGLIDLLAFEWDGANWQQVATLPQAHFAQSAAYDAARQVTVLSAITLSPAATFETWEWDGTTWSLRHSGGQMHFPLAFDPVRQQVITTSSPTRAWDGTTWTQISTAPSPASSTLSTGADPARGRLWAFSAVASDEAIWAWDGTAWSRQLAGPHTLDGSRATYDSSRGRLVVLGTTHREWDGHTWHDIIAAGSPIPRSLSGQVYDAARGETIVFGGQVAFGSGAMTSRETWAFDGITWRLAATTGPTGRTGAMMTYDSQRARVVLVGGNSGSTLLADHWEWDGQAWTQVGTVPMNPASIGALGYDAANASLVFTDLLGRTWLHNGTAWSQVATNGPTQLSARALVFDGNRQRLQVNSGVQRYEWDGTQWIVRFADRGELAFDSLRGAMLTYTPASLRTETTQLATAADFGSSCGGTTTTTSLTAFGRPRPGDPAFHLDLRAEATLSPAMIVFGFGQANVPLANGCTLHVQQSLAAAVSSTDVNGLWHHALPLPNALALRGLVFEAQGGLLDPASPGGFALTQGLTLTIGD